MGAKLQPIRPHSQACGLALTQRSHSAEGGFSNSLAQGQIHFLMDTKALNKIAENLLKYTNNTRECVVEVKKKIK